jgi:hypothetical protein
MTIIWLSSTVTCVELKDRICLNILEKTDNFMKLLPQYERQSWAVEEWDKETEPCPEIETEGVEVHSVQKV